MPSISIKELSFSENKFRKLKSISIPIANRITIIAGHNGIGKSTILALLAHPSGLTSRKYKSYFGKTYQANFNQIIHIDFIDDFQSKLGPPKTLSEPSVTYTINKTDSLTKACRLGPRDKTEARIVARTIKPSTKSFTSSDKSITVGPAQKVPLPTIYLGMTRLLPLGEAEEGSASSAALNAHPDDSKLISEFINNVIPGSNTTPANVTIQKISNTGKISGQPKHAFDARCVSVGQDSLGSIALALASFQKLKREWDNYPGGLLIIDEIDSGLHPHAIGSLARHLKKLARNLGLQIIATTHSPRLIEAIHPESEPHNKNPLDAIIYIRDTASPKLLKSPTLSQIINDMNLIPPGVKLIAPPNLKVYFEDDEAKSIFSAIATNEYIDNLGAELGISIQPLPLGLGCGNLSSLSAHDSYFKSVVIILDADSKVDANNPLHANIALLPGDSYSAPLIGNENKDIVDKPLAPERSLLQFILNIINLPDENESTLENLGLIDVTTDQLKEHLLDGETTILSKREQTKKWWKEKYELISKWGLISEWVKRRPDEAEKFRADFEKAIAAAIPHLKAGQANP
ncbi:ATP-dependent nuclease [Comamonas sp. B21-038]|uniref:ATP-dependent nuclease n=1 Tax=Comamonas sp. B21-038 TaxID=2918299 RepID=UPI001EFA4859|nr:AAA family ATPase [Comamonas sp. B21-038]ULR90910.1 AAA family ATPase [Comamonas sp. B21-038]